MFVIRNRAGDGGHPGPVRADKCQICCKFFFKSLGNWHVGSEMDLRKDHVPPTEPLVHRHAQQRNCLN